MIHVAGSLPYPLKTCKYAARDTSTKPVIGVVVDVHPRQTRTGGFNNDKLCMSPLKPWMQDHELANPTKNFNMEDLAQGLG